MPRRLRLPYTPTATTSASLMPRLSLTLKYEHRSVEVVGLLDTGAAVNVLPYSVGVALGANWSRQTTPIPLVGALGQTNFFMEFDVCFFRSQATFEVQLKSM